MLEYCVTSLSYITKMFWRQSGFLVLFFMALIYIVFGVKEKKNKTLLAGYSGLILAVIYNPIIYFVAAIWLSGGIYAIKQYMENGMSNGVRLFYTLPITFVIAYAMVELVNRIKNIWKKRILILFICLIIMGSGKNVYSNGEYTNGGYVKAENIYKLPQEVLDISDVITESTAENEECKVLISNDLIVYIRQYNSDICMPYGRGDVNTEIAREFSAGTIQESDLITFLDEEQCNYVVVNMYPEIAAVLEQNGYEMIGETERHMVFKIKQ